MTVDILMTFYDAPELVATTIQSVLNQTYPDWTLTIADDGSAQGLPSDALELCADPRITVLRYNTTLQDRRECVRYAHLINEMAARTHGELIAYLAQDDLFEPDRLERMVATITAGADVVYGIQRLLDSHGNEFGRRAPMAHDGQDAWHKIDLNSVLHTRESFEKAGGWPTDSSLWADADGHAWRRLQACGYHFTLCEGGPTDAKRFRHESVTECTTNGREPWDRGWRPEPLAPHTPSWRP
jgi:glycosyltransferase involved in cell wall biosynthesis